MTKAELAHLPTRADLQRRHDNDDSRDPDADDYERVHSAEADNEQAFMPSAPRGQ
jgi:hypothetical protein